VTVGKDRKDDGDDSLAPSSDTFTSQISIYRSVIEGLA